MTWKNHSGKWWTLRVPSIPRALQHVLEELDGLPGVQSVYAARQTPLAFVDVTIVLHQSALSVEPMTLVYEACQLSLPDPQSAMLAAVPTLRELRDYQHDGADWLVENRGGVLGDSMGLGKTTTAVVAAERMRMSWHAQAPVLIVGPRFVRDVWRRELQAVLGDSATMFACSGRKPTIEQEAALAKARWIFIHYDILDGWRAALTRPMYAPRPIVCIVDEAHWAKNPLSKRGKAVLALAPLAQARIALTGTPIENKVTDLWTLLTIAAGAGSFGSSFNFAHRYTFHEKDTYGWTSRGAQRTEELRKRLEDVYLRRTLDDVGAQIPPLTRELFEVCEDDVGRAPGTLTKWAGGNLALAGERIRDALAAGSFGQDTLAAINAWRSWTSETKTAATAHLAASLVLEGESVVIFTWQRAMAETLATAIEAKVDAEKAAGAAYVVHGGIDQEERDQIVAHFQASSNPCCIVATIDSLKEGVTLHAARRVIIHDLDWLPTKILQAEARIHRLNQLRACIATWMVVPESIDDILAQHLTRKAQVISETLQDPRAAQALSEVGLGSDERTGAEMAARILGDDA